MTGLIDVHGRPLKSVLKREFAEPRLTGVRSLMVDAIAPGLTPQRMAAILRAADEGDARDYLTLAEEMEEREFHYISVLGTRKRALTGLDIVIENDEEGDTRTDEITDAVRELTDRPQFIDLLQDLVDALGKGYAASEIMWDTRGGRWTPAEFIARDPRFFVFDRITRRELRLAVDGMIEGEALPRYKFVRHVPRLKSGIPIRGGLAKPAAWAFIFKSYTLKDWAAFCEVYGMPIRVGKYGPNATAEDRQKLLTAVRNIGTDAAAIIPETMAIEFVEAGKGVSTGGSAVFAGLAEYLDKQLSKLILGQTMTTDDGASMAQAKVHQMVRMDILAADARQLEVTINRDIIIPFVTLNWGPQKTYPRFTLPVAENEDLTALAGNLSKLVPLGFRVREAEVRDRFGFTDPEEGDLVLGASGVEEFTRLPDPEPETGDEPIEEKKPAPKRKAKPKTARQVKAQNKAQRSRAKTPSKGCCGPEAKPARGRKSRNKTDPEIARQLSLEADLDRVEEMGLGDWEEVMDPVLKPIREVVNAVSTYDEFLARLPDIFSQMDAGKLIATLAASMAIARGLGDARQPA